jgi:hypothetical protein
MDWRSQISDPDRPFCSKQCWYDSATKSLVGQVIGKLTVLSRFRKNNETYYKCSCACGNTSTPTHPSLLKGTSSCGCAVLDARGSERKPLGEVLATASLNVYKRNAKLRGYKWSLPRKKFVELINGNCYYCGIEPCNEVFWHYKDESVSMMLNGVDRLDNTKGYTTANSVSCCKTCNFAKNELTLEEFKVWALRLAKHISKL